MIAASRESPDDSRPAKIFASLRPSCKTDARCGLSPCRSIRATVRRGPGNRSFFLCLAACRTRFSALVTRAKTCWKRWPLTGSRWRTRRRVRLACLWRFGTGIDPRACWRCCEDLVVLKMDTAMRAHAWIAIRNGLTPKMFITRVRCRRARAGPSQMLPWAGASLESGSPPSAS
jgi:hypothetical protein